MLRRVGLGVLDILLGGLKGVGVVDRGDESEKLGNAKRSQLDGVSACRKELDRRVNSLSVPSPWECDGAASPQPR